MPKRPVGRQPKLTLEVEKQICAYIRAGAFAWVAATASGIGKTTFYTWMASDDPRYREFQAKVEEAKSQARAGAEMEVRKLKPEVWLRLGPGREKPDEPGWTEASRTEVSVSGQSGLVIMLPPENPDG